MFMYVLMHLFMKIHTLHLSPTVTRGYMNFFSLAKDVKILLYQV